MAKRTGNVYWANSQKIDKSDTKVKRQYAVVKDNGRNVVVSKIRGFNDNPKNNTRLFELDKNKYPLSKRSGVDKKTYFQRVDNKRLLNLNDKEVFDEKVSFKLSSHDTHKVLMHTGVIKKTKKRRP